MKESSRIILWMGLGPMLARKMDLSLGETLARVRNMDKGSLFCREYHTEEDGTMECFVSLELAK